MAANALIEIAVEGLVELGSSGPKGCMWAIIILILILVGIIIYSQYYP